MASKTGWISREPLPGGDFDVTALPLLAQALAAEYPFIGTTLAERLAKAYGTRARLVLGTATSLENLGRQFGATLTEREVRYLMDREWARTADDVLWRRSKLGLRMTAEQARALECWMQSATTGQLASDGPPRKPNTSDQRSIL